MSFRRQWGSSTRQVRRSFRWMSSSLRCSSSALAYPYHRSHWSSRRTRVPRTTNFTTGGIYPLLPPLCNHGIMLHGEPGAPCPRSWGCRSSFSLSSPSPPLRPLWRSESNLCAFFILFSHLLSLFLVLPSLPPSLAPHVLMEVAASRGLEPPCPPLDPQLIRWHGMR